MRARISDAKPLAGPRMIEATFGSHPLSRTWRRHSAVARAVDGRLEVMAARGGVPAIYDWSELSWSGGLITYGVNRGAAHRRMGGCVGRILKGARPADMPFARADKIELFINMQTAKALGLAVPQSLLAQADQVIA